MVGMEKPTDKASDHQDNTFSPASAIVVLLKGASTILLTATCFTLIVYGALALLDWVAG